MKFIANIISAIRPVRFLFTALMCTLLLFAGVTPAQAGNMAKSKPTDGTDQLQKIDAKAQTAIDKPATNLKQIEERSKNGLNEVQGSADKDKMYTSKSSKPVVADKLEKALDKATK
jgi:hypothetical protein